MSAPVPERQSERNAALLEAVRAGRSDIVAALARADPPADATDAERERWRIRRRLWLYRRVNKEGESSPVIGSLPARIRSS